MAAVSHTPGPWELLGGMSGWYDSEGEQHPVVLGPNGENPICRVTPDWDGEWANARLIAAAPDLLEACEAIRVHFGTLHHALTRTAHDPQQVRSASEATAAVVAAILKARGEQL